MLDRKSGLAPRARRPTHRAHTRGRACKHPEDGLASRAKLAWNVAGPLPPAGEWHRGRRSWRRLFVSCAPCRASEGRPGDLAVMLPLAESATCELALFPEDIDSLQLMTLLWGRRKASTANYPAAWDRREYAIYRKTPRTPRQCYSGIICGRVRYLIWPCALLEICNS